MEQKLSSIVYTAKLRKHGKNSMVVNVPKNLHSKVKVGDTYQISLTPLWDLIQDEVLRRENAEIKEQELRKKLNEPEETAQ
jgi:hypothetical protein